MTLDQAIALDDTASVNWGELAADLLSPEQQAYYEGRRIPAWLRYQRHVAIAGMRHWSKNEEIMPIHWHTYRIATAQAFKAAAASDDGKPFVHNPRYPDAYKVLSTAGYDIVDGVTHQR